MYILKRFNLLTNVAKWLMKINVHIVIRRVRTFRKHQHLQHWILLIGSSMLHISVTYVFKVILYTVVKKNYSENKKYHNWWWMLPKLLAISEVSYSLTGNIDSDGRRIHERVPRCSLLCSISHARASIAIYELILNRKAIAILFS